MALSETDIQKYLLEAKTLEGLASTLDISIMIYDRNDTLIVGSSQYTKFFDVSPELLMPGARLRDLCSEAFDKGARVMGSITGKARTISREDWVAERIAIHWRERYESIEKLADGRWIRLCKRRLPDGVLIATIQDVSEQKRRDAELSRMRHQAELAQHILDNLVNPVMVKDSELRYVIVNDAFCGIPGLHPKQVIGRTAKELVDPELATRFEEAERQVLETGVPFDTLEDIYRYDGTVMHAITRARRSGTPGNYYVTVSFDDVSAFAENGKYEPQTTSRYSSDMPSEPIVAPDMDDIGSQNEPSGRVLVLDQDSHRSANRVEELKKCGADAIAISDANEAIAFMDAARSMKLELSDIEVTAEIAKALSAQGLSAAHAALKQAVDRKLATIAKPVAQASKPVLRSEPEPKTRTGRPPARISVLVAEDNDVNQIVFEQILEGIGVDYRIVANGQEAVEAWRAAVPDLILMDISMPVMNGLQAAQAIRDAEAQAGSDTDHVPIIAVTAHAMSGDKERCFEAGMDDYLSKPVSPEKLESIIKKWIDRPDDILRAV